MMRFNTILIPVDFTVNTEVAIRKAVELCQGERPNIHLLHVPRQGGRRRQGHRHYFSPDSWVERQRQQDACTSQMEKLVLLIRQLNPDIRVYPCVHYDGSVEHAIVQIANKTLPDLIIIGKNSRHTMFPFLNTVVPGRIAEKSHIPVLTVKPGSLSQAIRMVVVPVGTEFPVKKVEAINALRNKSGVHIRLLILLEKDDDADSLQSSLVHICQVLKTRTVDNLSYEVIPTRNRVWDILRYSKKVGADLLIVHPESETRIGWFNKQISDEIPAQSRTQVLAVAPS